MNMAWIDWVVVAGFYVAVISIGLYCKKFTRGVADFLVAGRGMRKYLGYATGDASAMGAVSVVAGMELCYRGGPATLFYSVISLVWGIFIGLTGFVIKRYRETRIITQPQLFEIRYSKGVRILAAVICVVSGLIAMGIAPVIVGRFFVYFGGLPTEFILLGAHWNTIHVLMAFLIGAAMAFTFMGGQVSVAVTDFIQAVMMSVIFVAMGFAMYRVMDWKPIASSLLSSGKANMLLNPFAREGEFGLKMVILVLIWKFFVTAASVPSMQKISSAASPRDARIIMLLYNLRLTAGAGRSYCALGALAMMALPAFAWFGLGEAIGGLDPSIQTQMATPMLIARIMPVGILGMMFAGMLAADISTNDTQMLCWGGIIVQDIICPLRKKPFTRKQHLILLRLSVLFVGIFIYFFGLFYKSGEAIVVFQLTAATIYIAGAGTIITLGLYWRRGNTYGAYTAIIVGALLPVSNHIFHWIDILYGASLAYIAAFVSYIIVSLLTPNPHFNLEKMLNRPPKTRRVE